MILRPLITLFQLLQQPWKRNRTFRNHHRVITQWWQPPCFQSISMDADEHRRMQRVMWLFHCNDTYSVINSKQNLGCLLKVFKEVRLVPGGQHTEAQDFKRPFWLWPLMLWKNRKIILTGGRNDIDEADIHRCYLSVSSDQQPFLSIWDRRKINLWGGRRRYCKWPSLHRITDPEKN